jgi:hypothetical protein
MLVFFPKFMKGREVVASAKWCRVLATSLALALGAGPACAEKEVPRTIERAGKFVEKTGKRAGKFVEKTARKAGRAIERGADRVKNAF